MEMNTDMKEYHYVISYNPKTNKWVHEYDVESVKFDSKTIWNSDEQDWESTFNKETGWDEMVNHIDSLMNAGLDYLNQISPVIRNNNVS